MLFCHASNNEGQHQVTYRFLLLITLLCLLPVSICAQGSGKASSGTGGNHIIQGYVFLPSGRRAEGSIQIKLQSHNSGDISVMADASGSFTFEALSPGNYTVVVLAGDAYEPYTEGVFIDNDVDLSRLGIPQPKTSHKYTVMIHLRPKTESNRTKASVLDASLAEVPESARKLYEKGLEQAQAGEKQKAVESLSAAIALYPKFPRALNELGVQYLKLGQPGKAAEALKTAAELRPDAFTPRLNLGIALLETRRFSEAEAQLREALKQNATAATAHMYLGLALTHLKNYDEAEKELLQATSVGSEQLGMAHYYLGGLYWRKQNYSRAADELDTYLRLSPNAADAERVRATVRDLRGRLPNKFTSEGNL